MRKKLQVYASLLGLFLIDAQTAVAQGVDVSQIGGGQVSSFPEFVGVLYAWGARLGISLAIIMTIYSGYLYMTSSGNLESTKTAKEYLTGAIVGLALIFLSYLILNTISPNLV